ncbi:unnamed protein product [Chilo suppressalis]|uniref:Shugoshin C-terminal domain-containing protein n=1 Tax=Chilo suppressalis TaxID=168631 RepID=A0ABN8B7W5_CHISP|nr:unnamed protein product [Chilo suppressalis]
MSSHENEIKDLREKNNELVQKVQYWKITAAQRETEKLELMKENNELRLKLSRIRSGGAAQARKLDAALQAASEEALSHLVQASGAVAQTLELAKTYIRDRQELDNETPRWSNISGNSNADRVHRVPPLMMGGMSIQPVVSLSRTVLNTSNSRSVASRSPQQNRSITERAVPLRMLQDVYIPLTRIDANDLPGNNVETDETSNIEDSTDDLGLDDSNERTLEESHNITEEDFESSGRLDAVTEELEPEDEMPMASPPSRNSIENPLEGPSWLLDIPDNRKESPGTAGRSTLEPDSTTEPDETHAQKSPVATTSAISDAGASSRVNVCPPTLSVQLSPTVRQLSPTVRHFSPTVRRRKRTSSPPQMDSSRINSPRIDSPPTQSPRLAQRRPSNISGRVLKVVLAKMRLDAGGGPGDGSGDASSDGSCDASPPKRVQRGTPPPARHKQMRFDAPSPNGTTDAGVIVSEALQEERGLNGSGDGSVDVDAATGSGVNTSSRRRDTTRDTNRDNRSDSASSRDSHDSVTEPAEGRSRRAKKPIIYKEKPLNRKMRR